MTLLLPLCRYVVHSHTHQTWYNVTTIWYHELIEGKGNFCCLLIGRICVLKTLRIGIMPWYKTILEFVWWLLLIRKAFNIKRRRGLEFDLIKCEVFFATAWMFVCCTYFRAVLWSYYLDQGKCLKMDMKYYFDIIVLS